MLLYDTNYQLKHISEELLTMLELFNVQAFHDNVEYFEKLFVKQTGYIYDFEELSWIDYVLHHPNETHKAVIKYQENLYECTLHAFLLISTNNNPNTIAINIKPIQDNKITAHHTPTPIEEPTFIQEAQKIQTTPTKTFDARHAAQELGLPVEIILEFVDDFVTQVDELSIELTQAIKAQDSTTIDSLTHKLKGVAANLRIDEAIGLLDTLTGTHDSATQYACVDALKELAHSLNTKATPSPTLDFDTVTTQELHSNAAALHIDTQLYETYLDTFIDEAVHSKELIQEYLKTQDFSTPNPTLHALKQSALTLGLKTIEQTLNNLIASENKTQATAYTKEFFEHIKALKNRSTS